MAQHCDCQALCRGVHRERLREGRGFCVHPGAAPTILQTWQRRGQLTTDSMSDTVGGRGQALGICRRGGGQGGEARVLLLVAVTTELAPSPRGSELQNRADTMEAHGPTHPARAREAPWESPRRSLGQMTGPSNTAARTPSS